MKRKIEVEISSDAFCARAALAYFSGLHPEDIAVEILENPRGGAAVVDVLKCYRYVEPPASQQAERENPAGGMADIVARAKALAQMPVPEHFRLGR